MKRRTLKKQWREANYHLAWLFILLYVACQFLYQYQTTDALATQAVIVPVPDGSSALLADKPYLLLQPTATPTPVKEESEEEQIKEFIDEVFGKDAELFKRIAECESHYKTDARSSMDAWGVFQIHYPAHKIPIKWLKNWKINVLIAKQLYDEQGLTPWEPYSGHCWK